MEVQNRVLDAMSSGKAMTWHEVAEVSGLDKSQAATAISRLVDMGVAHRLGRGVVSITKPDKPVPPTRKQVVLGMLNNNRSVPVSDIIRRLDVSRATIRILIRRIKTENGIRVYSTGVNDTLRYAIID